MALAFETSDIGLYLLSSRHLKFILNIRKIIIITIILIVIDSFYLYFINNLFQEQIIKIQNNKMKFRFIGAIIFSFWTLLFYYKT